MGDRIGQQLGNYRLTGLLGQGGFADVYLAEHMYLNTKAAIKVLQTRMTNEDSTSFLNEARTIANLIHPHIVRVLDYGLEAGTPFLVMDYAPFGTLRQRHPKGVTLSPDNILPYVKQIASALMYAHERKLIHRDVKPENMLIGYNNDILLSDFGIALATQSSRYQGTMEVVGTAGYMAPEQIQGKPRPASDQYALGIVVYEWLSGERPFQGSFTEIASQHIFAPPPPLHEKVAVLPDVEQVVMMALAKDPDRRFQTVQAFATAFEQACHSNAPSYPNPSSDALTYLTPSSNAPTYVTPASRTPPPVSSLPPPVLAGQLGQSAPVTPVPQEQPLSQRRISRRMVIVGLAGVAGLAVAASGIAWLELSQRVAPTGIGSGTPQPTQLVSTPTTAAPTATTAPAPTATTAPPTTPPSTLGNLLFTYHGHSGNVYADVWSPSGGRVASCAQDKTVQVWDATTGASVLTYSGHTDQVYAVSWSSDGQSITSGGEDKTVQVWNAGTGNSIFSFHGHSFPVYAVGWSPNGGRIASGSGDKTVQVWDATTGGNVLTYTNHSDLVRGVAWSPDGSRIASASEDKTVQIWDAATGNRLATCSGHTDGVLIVAWSPDGTKIVSGSRDATVRIWNASSGSNLLTYTGHSDRVWSVAWSPNGQRIASGGKDSTVQIWDAASRNTLFTYHGHSATVWSALWSPDGQRIASASNDVTVQVWQAV